MNYEFRISAAAEFMEIHADAFAIGVDAQGQHAVEEPKEQIEQGQDEPKQSGDADQLRHQLAGARGKCASGEESPEATRCVCADCAGGVVDGDGELKHLDQQWGEDSGDESDEEGRAGKDQGRGGAGGDESGEPSVGAEACVGLAEAESSVLTAVPGNAESGAWSQRTAPATLKASQPTRATRQPKRM